MKILSQHAQKVPHGAAAVYQVWADPRSWPMWDPDVAEVRFEGAAVAGATGWMRPASGPATKFTIAAARDARLFTSTSRLPGAVLSFEHALEPSDDGSRVAVRVGVTGTLSRMWSFVLRRSFADTASRNIAGLTAHLDAE